MADVRYNSVSDRGVLGLFATNIPFPFPLVTANFNRRLVTNRQCGENVQCASNFLIFC